MNTPTKDINMTAADDDNCPTTPSKTRVSSPSSGNANNNNNIGAILSNKIDALPRSVQFISLAICVFFFFGIHNIIQEAMINTEGFTFGVMLGWMEVLGVTLCSGLERSSIPFIGNGEGRQQRMAPWQAYPPLTICLLMSSSFASWSLNYINFPTKVVFRSCKLLPTMILAYIMGNAKRFTYVEVGSAVAVCAGLITFAAGDWSLSKPQFHPFGLTLVSLSVFADAVLPNAQERLFRKYDASKSEVMFFTNIYTLVVQTASTFLSGDLMGMFNFVTGKSRETYSNIVEVGTGNSTTDIEDQGNLRMETVPASGEVRHKFIICMILYILISHVAVSAHTQVVRKFGGVAAVFVGTARKGMTLMLSFAIFPKESNWRYALGAILVLGGLTVASLEKQRNKRNKNKRTTFNNAPSSDGMILVPELPIIVDKIQPKDVGNGQRDYRTSECQPLIKDVEMSRSSSAVNNGPERRR